MTRSRFGSGPGHRTGGGAPLSLVNIFKSLARSRRFSPSPSKSPCHFWEYIFNHDNTHCPVKNMRACQEINAKFLLQIFKLSFLSDTFASKTAAIEDDTADNSVGNVTGSNAVNVFLGIGIAWTIAAVYWESQGLTFDVPVGRYKGSIKSVARFCCEHILYFPAWDSP